MSKCCWENSTNRLAHHRVATNFQSVKKTQYLRSTTQQSTVKKQGMPVLGFRKRRTDSVFSRVYQIVRFSRVIEGNKCKSDYHKYKGNAQTFCCLS